ncbi:MAG: transposase, partial [Terriglobia bacterium]|nr:transposase [Terriglobia bacterium]
TWRSLPVIKALMTLRAIDFLSATTIVAELGDLRRFPHPRELMGYLGLKKSRSTVSSPIFACNSRIRSRSWLKWWAVGDSGCAAGFYAHKN